MAAEELDVAVRAAAFPPPRSGGGRNALRDLGPSEWTLVFDTETTTDSAQRLRVGAYEARRDGVLEERGLFFDQDALSPEEVLLLRRHAEMNSLKIRTRADFVEAVFMEIAWRRRGLVIGMNLPFDISRLAIDHAVSRPRDRKMRGGFSFVLTRNPFLPNVQIKRINSRAAFIRLTAPKGSQPEHRNRQKGGDVANHNGYFVDVGTLAAAMMSFKGTLGRLAVLLDTAARKHDTDEHGDQLSDQYLEYLLNDVEVTWECFSELQRRYDSWRLTETPIYRVMSEASIGKGYLRQMGLMPVSFDSWHKGVMAAVLETYYGGRTETKVRRIPIPGTYVDFKSHYPTVFALMGMWSYVAAQEIYAADEDPSTVMRWLDDLTVDDLFQRDSWTKFNAIVQIQPDNDSLPTRAAYGDGRNFNVALTNRVGGPAQYWTLADTVASRLMTGRTPQILRVIRFRPGRQQEGLRSIEIAANRSYSIRPHDDDFVKSLVELRTELKDAADRARSSQAATLRATAEGLKIAANSVAYGIAIEINTVEHSKRPLVTVELPDGSSYQCRITRTEEPGRWFNPVVASQVAAGGRLLLALAMRLVGDEGGEYVFCDTDSLFIAAGRTGRAMPCEGGSVVDGDGDRAIKLLSWHQVDRIITRFSRLNPYDIGDRHRSILELEKENFHQGTQREILCFSIASKRYALFVGLPV